MNEIVAVIVISVLAVISPGADFAMVTRNSFLYGRKSGVMSALGISLGVQVHVIYTIFGIGLLISQSPSLFMVVKFIGAAYLIYIGFKTIKSVVVGAGSQKEIQSFNSYKSFKTGFFTNALNPKTMFFVLSVFTQFLNKDTGFFVLCLYGVFMSLAHLIWFCIVAIFFSTPKLREGMLKKQRIVNNFIGGVLMFLGVTLFFSPMIGS
ncbi:RhtB (resistance to homoserine/threonine) family protein [Marinomonas alcarazii]|uniref:RhtB (Resistance to homoserine/threonine) family protein n=1 Tax=Marinomonas alcarazii TaxID=491949 RepID=A0A318V9P8_9GAMM|nr:LysE family transporter [Marinomonas alcarazii]PYF84407.1 RhtB (resistance to homoserine/threonine) family protein [Marinomonas alcarazii]